MDQVVAFTPRLEYLSDGELERNEKERERELNRRRRKTTRGRRGVALPDREPPKTFRTPAIGFPEVDPATLALVAAAAAPTSRRAAAAAASLTIANMVASENGTSLSPQTMPTPVPISAAPQPAASKEKKPKGLIKAPYYDQHAVLRPRSKVAAPTPSTAADPATVAPPLDIDPPVSIAPAENKGARVPLSAKRAKELEREAKEKEYVDGQHANIIDGVWHCSNCGCPESIAVGRRKGPLGDKSQCGTCGTPSLFFYCCVYSLFPSRQILAQTSTATPRGVQFEPRVPHEPQTGGRASEDRRVEKEAAAGAQHGGAVVQGPNRRA